MRLIDADTIPWCNYDLDNYLYFVGVDKEYVDEIPTIDAVPVVRCKDCKWYKRGIVFKDTMFCYRPKEDGDPLILIYKENDFCSYGERKGGEG